MFKKTLLKTIGLKKCCLYFLVHLKVLILIIYRSSRQEVFCNKGVLKNFTKFTGKHLCQSLFFNKIAGGKKCLFFGQACNFIKKETLVQVFSCEFCEIFKNAFFIEHLCWLLLNIHLVTLAYLTHWARFTFTSLKI